MVTTPSQTPRSGGFLPISPARPAPAVAQMAMSASSMVKPGVASHPVSSIQAVQVGSRGSISPVSTMTTTPVSAISELEISPTFEEKRSRIKVGAPFDVPRASIRAKCPSWSDTPAPKVWHPKRPAQRQCEGSGEKTSNVSKPEKSVSNDKGKSKEQKEKCSPSPKGRARSDSPLLSRARRGLSGLKKRGASNKLSMSTSSLLSSAGRQTPLTRVLEEKDEAEDQEGGLSSVLNCMEDSILSLFRRGGSGSSAITVVPPPMTRCSDVARKDSDGGSVSERTLAGQLQRRLEHVRQMSSQEPQVSDESCASTPLPPSDIPSRWHSARLVESQRV